jgi:phage-related protein (TIGR01555 family)
MERVKLIDKPKPHKRRAKTIRLLTNRLRESAARKPHVNSFTLPEFPKGVAPDTAKMAMDDAFGGVNQFAASQAFAFQATNAYVSAFQEGLAFPGYAFLSELAQRPEYRRMSEIIATEMTRKWIKFSSVGMDDSKRQKKITDLEDEMDRLHVRDCFRKCIELDGFFGRSHLYVDTGYTEDREELKTSIGDGRNQISEKKIGKDAIKAFRPIEPVWTYPTNYNSIDPLKQEWYEPETWFVMGKEIHRTRLLKFVGREVPDLLKPAYAFGGLSLSQMAKPYVDNWLRTRQSVSDIVHSFSVFVLKTDLSESLSEGGEELFERAEAFNLFRDNKGLMLLDMVNEEFANISAPLGSLDHLQAQAQEHMASVSGIPLVKLTGISPSGLNATSEFEVRAFYDWILAFQEKLIKPNLTIVIDMIQLSKWGYIDDDIVYSFVPLWSLTEMELAQLNEVEARTGGMLMEAGVIAGEEERERVAAAPDSPYASIDVEKMPEPPQQEGMEGGMPGPEGEPMIPPVGGAGHSGVEPAGERPPAAEGEEDADDTEPDWAKTPYEEGKLRSGYLEGKHRRPDDYLNKDYLDPNYIRKRLGIHDESMDDADRKQEFIDLMYEGLSLLQQAQLKSNPLPMPPQQPSFTPTGERVLDPGGDYIQRRGVKKLGKQLDPTGEYLKTRRAMDAAEPLIGAFDSGGRFEESKHPRGQPENAGQFGAGGGGEEKQQQAPQAEPQAPKPAQITNAPGAQTRAKIEKSMASLNQRAEQMETELKDPDSDRTYAAISFMNSVVELDKKLPMTQRRDYRFAYAFNGDDLVGAIAVQRINPSTGEIKYLGSIQGGAGENLLKQGEAEARSSKLSKIQLTGNAANRSFYERHGYKMVPGGEEGEVAFVKNLTAHDAALDAVFKEEEHPRAPDGEFTSGGGSVGGGSGPASSSSPGAGPLDMNKMKKVGEKLGSNYGGTYTNESGKKFYIKKGKTPEHAKNENLAGKLYQLSGVQTNKYADVKGGGWIATEWQKYDKNNAKDFTEAERREAQKDFATHAWLANWDAAGLEYDNQAIIKGKPASIDLGGAMLFRGMGQPKGAAFGNEAGEWNTLRDKNKNYQNAKMFGDTPDNVLRDSAKRVVAVTDQQIRDAVKEYDMPAELADKLIKRRDDIGKRAGLDKKQEKKPEPPKQEKKHHESKKPHEKKHDTVAANSKNAHDANTSVAFFQGMEDMPKELNGVEFKPWDPPDDWADVDGQIELENDTPDDVPGQKYISTGLIMHEPDGRVWLVKPKGGYGGYRQTFPKGGYDDESLSMQANAIKEAYEESGLKGRVTGLAGDFEGDTSITRLYHATREGGTPTDYGDESSAVVLATHADLDKLLNRTRDKEIAKTFTEGGAHDKAANFKEEEHPRAPDGEFTEGAGQTGQAAEAPGKETEAPEKNAGVSRPHLTTKFVEGKRVTAEGGPLPEHIAKLRIPPAWTDVSYNPDPKGALQVTGKDVKGRTQSIYSAEHTGAAAAEKFARIKELDAKFADIARQNDEAVNSGVPAVFDSAECLKLIMAMGIRPGSEADTGGAKQAYGATTLQGRHVVRTEAGSLYLRFVGKKGVSLSLKVTDPKIAGMLERRAKEAGAKGKLFPHTTDKLLLEHTHSLDGGGFKTKDFRTYLGTKTAFDMVAAVKKTPTTEKEYKKAVKEVATKVSGILGNTPAIALQSYISPTVFADWRAAVGM